jgi:hypothetical protein
VLNGRDTVYSGVLTFLAKAVGVRTITRVPLPEQSLATANMPVLEQLNANEEAERPRVGMPVLWRVELPLIVYITTPDNDTADTVMCNLIDAVEEALAPDPATGKQTIGGLVVDCKLKKTTRDPGYQVGIGAAGILLDILTTS